MHELIAKARAFGLKAHTVQTYSDIYPYYKHLEDVYNTLVRFGFNESYNLDLLAAAFLHDVLEDTAISYNDLRKEFEFKIAEMVYCVTDELGRNRKERKQKTYPKIRSNLDSIVLKVCDRISNVEFAFLQKSPQFEMYQKEQKEFEFNLYVCDHINFLWEYLTEILFKNELYDCCHNCSHKSHKVQTGYFECSKI